MRNKPQQSRRGKTPPKVLVTGAAGFIGRRVVARLAAGGARVLATDRMPPPEDLPAGVEYRRADLGAGVDWIPENFHAGFMLVHLAWNMNRADAAEQAASVADFARVLEGATVRGLRGVAGMGSAEEYGELEGRLSENMAPGLKLSAYGRAKHEAGRVLEEWAREPGRRAIWLRPFVVYGSGQGGNMAIPYALRCALERRPAEFSEGLQFRDFVHVDDVAEGIAQAALRLPEARGPFAVCNLGRGEPVRLRDVLERIARRTGSEDLFRFGARPMRAGEPAEQYADISAAAGLCGWRAHISWKRGIDALCKEAVR
jgi:nucleoside-diphosphate-sugar epimerase